MENSQQKSLEEVLSDQREYWYKWIDELTKGLKYMDKLPDLQVEVFSRRQEALEQYHTFASKLASLTKKYKESYARIYTEIRPMKLAPGTTAMMYSTERAINDQIDARLSNEKYNIDLIESYMNYIDSTIKTIDGIIYAITNRIKIEEIKIGR